MGDRTLVADNNNSVVKEDGRLLEAALNGQTDLVLQLLEEEGQTLHGFRDKVRNITDLKKPLEHTNRRQQWGLEKCNLFLTRLQKCIGSKSSKILVLIGRHWSDESKMSSRCPHVGGMTVFF